MTAAIERQLAWVNGVARHSMSVDMGQDEREVSGFGGPLARRGAAAARGCAWRDVRLVIVVGVDERRRDRVCVAGQRCAFKQPDRGCARNTQRRVRKRASMSGAVVAIVGARAPANWLWWADRLRLVVPEHHQQGPRHRPRRGRPVGGELCGRDDHDYIHSYRQLSTVRIGGGSHNLIVSVGERLERHL